MIIIRSRRKKILHRNLKENSNKDENLITKPNLTTNNVNNNNTDNTNNNTNQTTTTTITEQLGIPYNYNLLESDLNGDYKLDIYNFHYHHDLLNHSYSINYNGFSQMSDDLYFKVSNPHVVMNEAGTKNFLESLEYLK